MLPFRSPRAPAAIALLAVLALARIAHAQQDLGHKTLGSLGLDAGTQPAPGLYLSDRVAFYSAFELRGARGQALPVGLDLHAFANGTGVGGVWKLPVLGASYGAALAVPVARVTLNTTNPEASVDRFGLADAYLQPLQLGWHAARLDAVVGYALYVPTRNLNANIGAIGKSQWAQEPSLGGTVYFDAARTWRFSALASLDLFAPKPAVDIRRGSSIQIQGGAGAKLARIFDLGLAGYALWQVSDDTGGDLPPALRGLRERTFGLGPEVGAAIPRLRLRFMARYEHDLDARARPFGQIFLLGLTWAAWKPEPAP